MHLEQAIVSAIVYYRRGLLTYEELLILIGSELHKLRSEVEECYILENLHQYVEN